MIRGQHIFWTAWLALNFLFPRAGHVLCAMDGDRTYTAYQVEEKNCPVLDGNLDDSVWFVVPCDSLLRGGQAGDYSGRWTNFDDFLVQWQSVWCEETNQLFVAVRVEDDIRGTRDNSVADVYYNPAQDESIEFFTDGDMNGGNYWPSFVRAQYWRVTQENQRDLEHYPREDVYPAPYDGTAFLTAVHTEENGNWTCEAVFTIYDLYPDQLHQLKENDQIGWDIWANDSDDETYTGHYYAMDHQVGWNYTGPVWKEAGYSGILKLGGFAPLPSITITQPDEEVAIQTGSLYRIKWEWVGNIGEYVSIHLYDGDQFVQTIASKNLNQGLFLWEVPYDLELKDTYKIRIRSYSNPDVSDYSDGFFQVVEGDPLRLLAPNEPGLSFSPGESLVIRWDGSSAVGDSVRIELVSEQDSVLLTPATLNAGHFTWVVNELPQSGIEYRIRIESVQNESLFIVSTYPITFGMASHTSDPVTCPVHMGLMSNYPNPFNPITTIPYGVSSPQHIRVCIYNTEGRLVNELIDAYQTAGQYTVQWNGLDITGQPVASGLFVVELRAETFVQRNKIMLLR